MKRIAIVNTDEHINAVIERSCEEYPTRFEAGYLTDEAKTIEYLNYELPELTMVNCTDPELDVRRIVGAMRNDPWLHSGGLVLIHDPEVAEVRPELVSELNLIASIETNRLEMYVPRLLRILDINEQILYHRDLHALLRSNLSGSFVLDNDPFDLTAYSNLLGNFLYNANLINSEQRERFHIALMELLVNAIEHGNCEISYEEKTRALADGRDPMELIREKNADPEISARKVYLSYRIRPNKSSFSIRDEGHGFDWRAYHTERGEAGLSENHGRGIFMASHYLSNLQYNEQGNEVSFELEHPQEESDGRRVPEAFSGKDEVVFDDGEIVFEEGEQSSHLYYIVSGALDVYAGDRHVSRLTPADIFVGEMSLVLGNRRTATVQSAGQTALIPISKEEFITAIKERPYYGLILARILSQRLVRLHELDG
jgi:anti-sigma regulatory factor (Ser/Thr protein kinase)